MDNLQLIRTRRSVRRYTPQPVSQEQVELLLRAAMSAPSAGNCQPWQFVVLDDRQIFEAIMRAHPFSQMLKEAPLAILVCGDQTLERFPGYWVQDCSAATQNLLLAAHALGLGAVWLGIHPRPERISAIRSLVGLPDTVQPLSLVAVGHPAETPPPVDRFLPERVHHNHW
jgi:nitroreductase